MGITGSSLKSASAPESPKTKDQATQSKTTQDQAVQSPATKEKRVQTRGSGKQKAKTKEPKVEVVNLRLSAKEMLLLRTEGFCKTAALCTIVKASDHDVLRGDDKKLKWHCHGTSRESAQSVYKDVIEELLEDNIGLPEAEVEALIDGTSFVKTAKKLLNEFEHIYFY
eukprot:g14035.t1